VNHDISTERAGADAVPTQEELENGSQNLSQAAHSATRAGIDLQHFMAAAYSAYLDANPALKQQIESEQMMLHLEELRRRGRLGQA